MAILEELKAKANGKADTANNIQEAISMMEFGGGSGGNIVLTFSEEGTTEGAETIYPSSVTAQEVINTLNNGGNVIFFENYTGTGSFSNVTRIISVTGYCADSYGHVMFEISENETDDGRIISISALSMESVVEKSYATT